MSNWAEGRGWPDGLPLKKRSRTSGAARKRRRLFNRFPECIWCGVKFLTEHHGTIEHLFPKRFGGTDDMANLALACEPCNVERGNWYQAIFGPAPRKRRPGENTQKSC